MLPLFAAALLFTEPLLIDAPYYFNGVVLVADDENTYFHQGFGVVDEDFQDPMATDRQFCTKYIEEMGVAFTPKTTVSQEDFPLLCPGYTELEDGEIVKNYTSDERKVIVTAMDLHQWAQKYRYALDMRSFQDGFTCSLFYDPQFKLSIVVLENTLWESKDLKRCFESHDRIRSIVLTNLNR